MSRKRFPEVFVDLVLEGDVRDLLEDAQISRIAMTPDRTRMNVYLESERLIFRQQIAAVEEAIRSQIFSDSRVEVKVIERFHLPEVYTARNLMQVYRESILEELRGYNIFLYNIFKDAKCTFTSDDTLEMVLPDSCVFTEHRDELVRILEKIFCERCGVNLKIHVQLEPPKESENRRFAQIRLEQEVAQISKRVRALEGRENDPEEYLRADSLSGKNSADGRKGDGPGAGKAAAGSGAESTRGADGAGKTSGAFASAGKADVSRGQGSEKTAGARDFGAGRDGSSHGGSLRGSGLRREGRSEYRQAGIRRSDNPDVLYGRDFEEDAIPLEQIVGEMGEVTIRGKILTMDFREIRGEKTIVMMEITDFTDTIIVKLFMRNENLDELKAGVKAGIFVKVHGVTTIDRFDSQLTIGSVAGIKKIADFRVPRMDTWPEKRVELHCHTKMSDMDGVSDVSDIIARAAAWGHEAIAITDHGVVQAFTEASHSLPKGSNLKLLYGCEGYLVDDSRDIAMHAQGEPVTGRAVVFDLETTGFSPINDRIIEIGAVLVEDGKVTDRFSTFVNPQIPIPFRIEQLTSINDGMVADAPPIEQVLPDFLRFCEGAVLVAHNASFDVSFIEENCRVLGLPFHYTYVDTVALARVLLPQLGRFKLDNVAKALNVPLGHHHRAVDDAECTAHIYEKFVQMLQERDIRDLNGVNALGHSSEEQIKKLPTYHIILIAKNDVGRVNLYRLVSWSHLNYFARRPRIPKSILAKYREGLIIGSACEAGELYRAIVRGASSQELAALVDFYDYLEIQPLGNNMHMTRDPEDPKTVEDLREYNRRIVALGEQYGKPVVATCDVHFLDPSDEIYRRIIMTGKGFKDADEQPPLFLRTTEEMLKEFDYLGEEKAREVVITNSVKIARMCERIAPVRPDKCPPVIDHSDQMLTDICYDKAHEIYGPELPAVVEERLKRELNSIISNGFAVMYIIAQKLVWKSNADGYLVGSRGSVGSSFVATMSGITEVNPLHPHYYCESCHFYDFDSPEVRKFDGMAGGDMPDRTCPVCGKPLRKEGFDIPFETFLGFKGNKEPDIDLNFSGEYQSKAHKYTEVIFGAGQTFRAGTIGTLAEKTAYGYVKKYFEEKGIIKRPCEINRIVGGCTGVRRATGQHPGGIIVLPYGEEIYTFTPVQHPANDMTTDIVTTHFDYHSIDHNLLKLDILGHDDPTMIRMLEDITDVNARSIPLDDREVMSLFQNTKALGITPEQIGGCPLGSLGIPEFGTEFAIQMLVDTKPQYFSDLVRIAGLAHGTDVWLGNAQTLILEGKATISTAICTRDDIMIYLIEKGMDSELSFTIMESVRKGKGLKPEWEQAMIEHGVPDWYIWSCKKIKYMFPKAHAAAYVMMAWRIAWFKINRPLAYYAAFFSIRAPGFDYELMCLGEERLLMHMKDYENRMNELSKKEQDEYKDMKVVREMYERGFEFMPIDIYRAQATRFQVIDGKLMPSLSSIDGMGDKAAEGIVDAVKDGKFLSRQDFRERAKVSKTLTDLLADLGILKGLPESNQLSLFDL